MTEKEHNFCQLQYTGWPEYGIPSSTSSIFLLIKAIRKMVELNEKNVNILVHCSSGAGRSGTFIALYYLLETLEQKMQDYKLLQNGEPTKAVNEEDINIDVFNTVFNVSKERCEMVM